ncbi:glutamate receptor 2.8 [Medicago truncatula]|uniref:Glutamate receptor 3.3, putative n=2 Tax=Medicago truncatula TaxID=3880 RepID=A0A072UAJ4_MEDTR|nr:glutamate receptor 2.8 [Medicago truncatula]KEH26123.1 glutamate receptor 3.3, putative [Medicago truncatula]
MAKSFSCYSWFTLFLLFVVETQTAVTSSGSNETSIGVIKLRVGVPKKEGFDQFVRIVWDSHENKYNVSGYCIDVFNAVVNNLTFKVSVQMEPHVINGSESVGSYYNSILKQIPTKYDVAVGDITIMARRAQFVDFTLPYTEMGVRMLVPMVHGRHQTMWIFVKPFSWDLWLSTLIISMLIGVVLLIMERNVHTLPHQDQSSSYRQQLTAVTILWFPISQAVLPERQVVAKNCSRFVLMVWLLLAFVLMQSYTANLTSILTVDQIQPRFLTLNDLKKWGYYVGYQTGSFVYDILVEQLKFDPSKLRGYKNIYSYHDALKLGSQGGGVIAIFDEVPYLNAYLQTFGSNYIIAGPTFRSEGFGFAFPYKSNLTEHFSRAILNVTENYDIMHKIEEKYFGRIEDVQKQSTQVSSASPSLTFHSFAGLFMITGISISLALIVSETLIWQKCILKIKEYTNRYLLRSTPSTETHVLPNDLQATQETN